MLVPVLIFAACMTAGVLVTSRWLPDLAAGSVGGLAFFVVCGLAGAALGLLSMHIYLIVEELDRVRISVNSGGPPSGEIVAAGIRDIVFEVGSLVGLAGVVYLLAPAPELDDELEPQPVA